jgi:excisionase family DNA binding protein
MSDVPDTILSDVPDMMSDTPDNHAGVTLAEAAALLGVSERTVLRRIEKGKLQGSKVDAERGQVWRVFMDGVSVTPDTTDKHPAGVSDTADITPATAQPEVLKALEIFEHIHQEQQEEIEQLRRENNELRTATAHWQARYQEAQETVQRLLPAPKDDEPEPASEVVERRPWWKFWG